MYAIHHTLENDGHDPDPLFKALDIDLNRLQGRHELIPKSVVNSLWKAVREYTGNDAFGLRVIEHLNDPSINALITSVQASQNIREALGLLLRYYKLIATGLQIGIELDEYIRIVVTEANDEHSMVSEDVDMAFALIVKHGSLLPANEVKPCRVMLTRGFADRWQDYEDFFQCPVEFNTPSNQLCFPGDALNETIPGANPLLSTHLERYLAEQSHRVTTQNLEQRLRAAILSELPSGAPRLARLAGMLNMSQRTLQRKLQQENLCYTQILDDLRLELARLYLARDSLPVQEVADRLGYSEASNFVRFFRQHEGITPSDYGHRVRKKMNTYSKDGAFG